MDPLFSPWWLALAFGAWLIGALVIAYLIGRSGEWNENWWPHALAASWPLWLIAVPPIILGDLLKAAFRRGQRDWKRDADRRGS